MIFDKYIRYCKKKLTYKKKMGKFRETIHFIIFIKLFFINYPYLGTEDEENCCITICPCFRNFKDKLEEEKKKLEEKESILQNKEKDLNQKEVELNNRGIGFNQKDNELQIKADELNQKEKDLNQRGVQLDLKENDINIKEEQLKKKDEEFNIKCKEQEASINEKNKELLEKNEIFINTENSLKQKESELEKKDEELKIKQTELEEKQTKFEEVKSEFDKQKLEFAEEKKKYREEKNKLNQKLIDMGKEKKEEKPEEKKEEKPEEKKDKKQEEEILNNNNNNNENNNNNDENKNNNNENKNNNNENKNNNNENKKNNNNENKKNNNNNEIIEEEPGKEDEDYSYDCTNAMYLTVYIYEGTEEAEFEIFLKNNGKKTWASDSKIINDPSSSLKTNDIDLAQQKPNEERGYKVVIKNLGRKPNGEYKIIFLFYTNKNIIGDKITAMVKIKEKDNEKSEMEENMDKILEFRDTFNLTEDEYSNEKIFEILKDNDFNFENAFSSLFN